MHLMITPWGRTVAKTGTKRTDIELPIPLNDLRRAGTVVKTDTERIDH